MGRAIHDDDRLIDILAEDAEGRPVLLVEVKDHELAPDSQRQLEQHLRAMPVVVPYAMAADREQMTIFGWDGQALSAPLAVLKTADILTPYEPEYGRKRIFDFYLIGLFEAWLRDLAFHWRSDPAPAQAIIERIGLLEHLRNGDTRSEVNLRAVALP